MSDIPTRSGQMTIKEYLAAYGATCEPCHPDVADHPALTIPQLPGWIPAPADTAPGAYAVLIDPPHITEAWCPNAVLLHGKLSAPLNTEELLACAFEDSRRLPEWCEYESSTLPYQGYPSVFIRGVYAVDEWTLSATTRYIVIADRSEQFLTQLTVTTLVSQAEDLDIDVTVMNVGLTISHTQARTHD